MIQNPRYAPHKLSKSTDAQNTFVPNPLYSVSSYDGKSTDSSTVVHTYYECGVPFSTTAGKSVPPDVEPDTYEVMKSGISVKSQNCVEVPIPENMASH